MIEFEALPNGIAIVTLSRPEKRNALNAAGWQELATIVRGLNGSGARAMVLTGDTHFSAGADISEFSDLRSEPELAKAYEEKVQACYDAISELPVPVIAAISGACVGGGCALSLACDFRVADKTARIGIPAAKLGVVYTAFETGMLFRVVGLRNAKRILYSGELLSAEQAREISLVDWVTESNVREDACAFAAELSKNAPISIAAAKLTLDALASGALSSRQPAIDDLVQKAILSGDYKEGVRAFLEKRAPVFRGH